MRQIAKGVGVTLPSIYFQFKDKRELYLHALIRMTADLNRQPDEVLNLADPADRLRQYVLTIARIAWDCPMLVKLLSRAMLDEDTDALEHIVSSVMLDHYKILLSTMESLSGRPASMVDVTNLYTLIMGLIQFRAFGGQIRADLAQSISSGEELGRHVLKILYPSLA